MNSLHQTIVSCTLLGSLLIAIICLSLTTGISPAQGAPQPESVGLSSENTQSEAISSPHVISFDGSTCRVSESYPESVRQWCQLITEQAEKHKLSPDLIAALIWQESGGNALAYSKSGAVGLMQVMPRDGLAASFQCPNGPCFASRPTINELQDPTFNVQYGTQFLASLLQTNGNIREALKSYGPANVGYYYADKVLGLYQTYGND